MAYARGRQALPVLLQRLKEHYPDARYELDWETPLQLLVATILAAQCTDERVNEVTKTLFVKYPDAQSYLDVPVEELEEDLKPTGFYRNKTKAVRGACQKLVDDFDGEVPPRMEDLLTLPGVARKTANVVLTNAFRIASGVIVDTHVARVSQRLGIADETRPEKIEEELLDLLPQREWIAFGPAVVLHGRYTCTHHAPKCRVCFLNDICEQRGVTHEDGDDEAAAEPEVLSAPAAPTNVTTVTASEEKAMTEPIAAPVAPAVSSAAADSYEGGSILHPALSPHFKTILETTATGDLFERLLVSSSVVIPADLFAEPEPEPEPVPPPKSKPAAAAKTAVALPAAAPKPMPTATAATRPGGTRSAGQPEPLPKADTIPESWMPVLAGECKKPYWRKLQKFVAAERQAHPVFPPENEVFTALALTPYPSVRVVLLGQDPYHDDGQAHGLCFSVKPGVKPPPSLVNIFAELQSDLGCRVPNHGYLVPWAKQGVLMLNAVLTVRAHKPNSHKDQGWELFTDAVIRAVDARPEPAVFVLWGSYAQKKAEGIDATRHKVIKAAHPSPLSSKKFFGSKPFSAVNDALRELGKPPIEWQLADLDARK